MSGSRVVLPAKAVGETKDFVIDFVSQIARDEVIESATCSVSVYCGLDLTPNAMLVGEAFISGTRVTQRLTLGNRGVIYMVTCTITTDVMQIVTIKAYLAVLDPEADLPSNECCTRIGVATSVNGKDYVITFPENPISAYRDGLPLYVIFDDTCTQDGPTLNPDSLGAEAIYLTSGVAASAYQILDGDVYQLVFSEDLDKWILLGRIPTQEIAFKAADLTAIVTTGEKFNMQAMKSCFILGARAGLTEPSTGDDCDWSLTADGIEFATITIADGENTSLAAGGSATISDRTMTGPWALGGEITDIGTDATEWDVILTVRFQE